MLLGGTVEVVDTDAAMETKDSDQATNAICIKN